MKKCRLLLSFLLILLTGTAIQVSAQGPYPNTGDHSVCVGSTQPYGVVLNAGSAYAWTVTPLAGGNGTIAAGATPNLITVNWTTVGTATLQVVETNSFGCVGIPVTIIVTVNPAPILVITNPPSLCAPATADLTAPAVTAGSTAGLTFTYWTDAAATVPYSTPTAATAGTYYIKGTTSSGCFDIKPVVVTITPSPTLVITNPAAVCSPNTADLTAAAVTAGSTPGMTLTYWTDAAATIPYATPATATAGTYYIKGTLSGGCFDIKAVTVTVNPLPTPAVTGADPVCEGTTSTYSTSNVAGHGYNWTVTGGTITAGQGTNSITVSWTAAGTQTVTVTESITATGCSAPASKSVVVNPKPATTPITHN